MIWSNWTCKQTIIAESTDAYTTGAIRDDNLILGRSKGYLEVYKIRKSLRKRIEYRSHVPRFDYLRSAEISESIEALTVLPSGSKEILVLSSNPKTVKLWSVYSSRFRDEDTIPIIERCLDTESSSPCLDSGSENENKKQVPDQKMHSIFKAAFPKKCIAALESECTPENIYNIHSVAVASNEQTVLVSDELSIHLFSCNLGKSWKVVDLKPQRQEELNRIISTAKFADRSSNLVVYGTSSGEIEMRDLRASTNPKITLFLPSFFAGDFYGEIVRPVSDIHCISDTLLVSRNLRGVLLHDLRQTSKPIREYEVYSLVKEKMSDLYDSDEIFSKFKMSFFDEKIYTGSFNSVLMEIDIKKDEVCSGFLDKDLEKATRIVDGKKVSSISVTKGCLAATVGNQCYILRPKEEEEAAVHS